MGPQTEYWCSKHSCWVWCYLVCLKFKFCLLKLSVLFIKENRAQIFVGHNFFLYMDTLAHGRSHLRGTGPSSYRTGPKVHNNLGPVPLGCPRIGRNKKVFRNMSARILSRSLGSLELPKKISLIGLGLPFPQSLYFLPKNTKDF